MSDLDRLAAVLRDLSFQEVNIVSLKLGVDRGDRHAFHFSLGDQPPIEWIMVEEW